MPSQHHPTNAEIMGAIADLAKSVDKPRALDAGLQHEIALMRQDLENRLKRIEEGLGNRGVTCPHRDELRRVSHNVERIAVLEQKVDTLEAQVIKASMLPGAAGGGIGALIASAIMLLGKQMGWW